MFVKALPVWLRGKEKEKNIQSKFVASFGSTNAELKITGATFYKVCLNGKLIHYGPSPTARGYARVDVLKLDAIQGENNTIVIEVAGYNCASYSAVKQTSFVQAEILCDGKCVKATGFDFEGYYVPSRVQKTMRYSFQRQFAEVWDLSEEDVSEPVEVLALNIKYLERRAPLPDMEIEEIGLAYASDKFIINSDNEWQIPSLQGAIHGIGKKTDRFELSEIEEKNNQRVFRF